VLELPFAAAQTLVDFPQRLALRHLAEEHRHKLIPTFETLAMLFSLQAFYMARKSIPIDQRKKLAKHTAGPYTHHKPPWFG
jgi:hypothetical protein